MTFLNPAILTGLIASAIPLVLHLFNLRKTKEVKFSTLMFMKEIQKSKIRRVKLKQWLLLILRTLIIASVVLGFARPALEDVTLGKSSSSKSTVCFLIDNSFSNELSLGSNNLLERAKTKIKKIINNFGENDEVSLFTLSGEFLIKSSNNEDIIKFLDKIIPEQKIEDINTIIKKIELLINNSDNYIKEFYLVSDFQKNLFDKIKEEQVLLDSKIFLLNNHSECENNLSVINLKLNNEILIKNKKVNFSADLFNSSKNELKGKLISLFINGKKRAQKSFDIKSGQTKKIIFETVLDNQGLNEALVKLDDDDIISDNKRFLSFYVPDEIKLLIIADNYKDQDYLNLVMEQDISLFDINKEVVLSENLKRKILTDYDVVFIVGNINSSSIKDITSFVKNGGGLVIFPSSESILNNLNSLVKSISENEIISFSYPEEQIGSFDKINFRHLLFNDLFIDKKQSFNSPELKKYVKIKAGIKTEKIISLINGDPILMENRFGKGNVLLFTISPELSYSNFPIKGIFAPLMNKILLYSGFKKDEKNSLSILDELKIPKNKVSNDNFKVIHPDNSEEFINLEGNKTEEYFNYKNHSKSGVYKFYSGNKLIEYFSVNFDPSESNLVYYNSEELFRLFERFVKKDDIKIIDLADKNEIIQASTREGTELWSYFIGLALILALIEMILSKSSKKEISSIS